MNMGFVSKSAAGKIFAMAFCLAGSGGLPALAAEAPKVIVQTVKYVEHKQSVAFTGEVVARLQTNLSFRIGGQIKNRFVDVGDKVTAGQLLASLDPEEQKADLEAAQANVRAAQAQVKLAQSGLDRQRALFEQGVLTRQDYEKAETAMRTAQGSLDAATAQRETAESIVSYTELRAPSDGVITSRIAESGQVAQAAQPMFTIADNGPRDAVFNVYESLFFQKPERTDISISLVADPAIKTTGQVREVSPTIDPATGTVRVKVAMDRTPAEMMLGASVVGLGQIAAVRVAVVPWTAMSGIGQQPALWVVDPKDNSVSLRPVEIASFESGIALVSGGVEPGETFVLEGTKLLRPGQIVDPQQDATQ